MKRKDYKLFLKKYDKFEKNNLPTPFWDDERQVLEYVYYDDEVDPFLKELSTHRDINEIRLHVESNLVDALSNVAVAGFYYPYNCKCFTLSNDNSQILSIKYGPTHSHSFEDVVRSLYDFPESFNISESDYEFYSKQELRYLRRVKKYLLFLGVKDLETSKAPVARYRNKLRKKYSNVCVFRFADWEIDAILNNNMRIDIRKYSESSSNYTEYTDYRALIVDDDGNICFFINYTSSEVKRYSEVKEEYFKHPYSDDELVCVYHFEVLETFKNEVDDEPVGN